MKAALGSVLLLLSGAAFAAERPLIAAKSEIGFSVKQMGVAISGGFKRFSAQIDLDPARPETGSAQVEVDVASISTGTDEGDDTVRDKPWLDAADFPKATFKSTGVKALGGDRYEVTGILKLRGRPREITVPFTLEQQDDGTAVASGAFTIQRADFGIGGGEWNAGDLVANEVSVHFRLTLGAPR